MDKFIDFTKRHSLTIMLLCISLLATYYMVENLDPIIRTMFIIVGLEALALLLSGMALYVYTAIDFTRRLSAGDDKKFNSVEQHAFARVIAAVFIGVHLLVGVVTFGIYLGQFQN